MSLYTWGAKPVRIGTRVQTVSIVSTLVAYILNCNKTISSTLTSQNVSKYDIKTLKKKASEYLIADPY